MALAPYKHTILPIKTAIAIKAVWSEVIATLTINGVAAKIAIIMPIKCVIALPGSRIVICIKSLPFLLLITLDICIIHTMSKTY